MTSEILISLPEVFQTFAPQRGGGAGTDSSSATFILISAEFLLPEDIFDFRFAETFPALACIVLKFWNNTKHSWYISIRFWFFYCSTKLRFVFCSIGILHAALENRLFTRHTGTRLIRKGAIQHFVEYTFFGSFPKSDIISAWPAAVSLPHRLETSFDVLSNWLFLIWVGLIRDKV